MQVNILSAPAADELIYEENIEKISEKSASARGSHLIAGRIFICRALAAACACTLHFINSEFRLCFHNLRVYSV